MNGPRTWALVMNSTRARILRGLATVDGEEHVEIVSRASLRHTRDVLAGLSDPSDPDRRHTESNAVIRDMQDFAAEIGDMLEQHRRAGDFARLAVFAPPRMLALLRTEFPATLRTAVVLEQAVNMINLPEHELRERVQIYLHNND
jgi:protein required for attachment to host cells